MKSLRDRPVPVRGSLLEVGPVLGRFGADPSRRRCSRRARTASAHRCRAPRWPRAVRPRRERRPLPPSSAPTTCAGASAGHPDPACRRARGTASAPARQATPKVASSPSPTSQSSPMSRVLLPRTRRLPIDGAALRAHAPSRRSVCPFLGHGQPLDRGTDGPPKGQGRGRCSQAARRNEKGPERPLFVSVPLAPQPPRRIWASPVCRMLRRGSWPNPIPLRREGNPPIEGLPSPPRTGGIGPSERSLTLSST